MFTIRSPAARHAAVKSSGCWGEATRSWGQIFDVLSYSTDANITARSTRLLGNLSDTFYCQNLVSSSIAVKQDDQSMSLIRSVDFSLVSCFITKRKICEFPNLQSLEDEKATDLAGAMEVQPLQLRGAHPRLAEDSSHALVKAALLPSKTEAHFAERTFRSRAILVNRTGDRDEENERRSVQRCWITLWLLRMSRWQHILSLSILVQLIILT